VTEDWRDEAQVVCSVVALAGGPAVTVALAALRLGRDAIGIDLDPRCAELAQQRIACVRPRVWHM